MKASTDSKTPYNAYPRDVTAPGPYQKRGVAQAQGVVPPPPKTPDKVPPQKDGQKKVAEEE